MKTIFKILILLFIPLFSLGQDYSSKIKKYNSKNIDELYTSEIGSSIFVSGYEKLIQVVEIKSCPEFKINFVKYPYKVGDKLPYYDKRKKWILYYNPNNNNLDSGTIGIAYNTETEIYIPYIKSYNGFITKMPKKGDFKVEKTTINDKNCSDCFKKELIYNGKQDNTIKFTYREFINNMMRPAFNQELSYDLTDGKVIGFKGLRIEIINTSNIGIEYKVQKYFD